MRKRVPRSTVAAGSERRPAKGVRLYVARGTPNSNRAELNLSLALRELEGASLGVPIEVVDVFSEPKRAIKDGIIVTPTLIGFSAMGRHIILGDLGDAEKLRLLLHEVLHSPTSSSSTRSSSRK